MTSKFAAALACALVASTSTARAADAPPDVIKTIAADYQLGCTAALDPTDANLTAAFSFLSPDYVYTDAKGNKEPRDEIVSKGSQLMKQLHTTACAPSIVSQSLNPDGTITVVSALHLTGSLQTPDGNHNLEVDAITQDAWKQSASAWQEISSQELHNTAKLDGTVIDDEGP